LNSYIRTDVPFDAVFTAEIFFWIFQNKPKGSFPLPPLLSGVFTSIMMVIAPLGEARAARAKSAMYRIPQDQLPAFSRISSHFRHHASLCTLFYFAFKM